MGRLSIYNSFKINGPVFVDGDEYGITTPTLQSHEAYVWDIHTVPKGEPPYKIGEVWLYKEMERIAGGSTNKIQVKNGLGSVVHTSWISVGLLKTHEPIIGTLRGSIRMKEI